MKDIVVKLVIIFLITSCGTKKEAQWWPQFRGPESSGVASEKAKPPVRFDDKNLLWKSDLPVGFSSPVIWDNKIFLTGFIEDKKELTTLCLNRTDGTILWKRSFTPDTLEKYHSISNPAQSTPVTDGERVITYFGSCGLICYDMAGDLKWKYLKPVPKFVYGNAASPVIAGDKIILLNDEGEERYLMAIDKFTGREIWKKDFVPDTLIDWGGNSTPLIYRDNIIIHRVGEVAAYSVNDGSYLWSYKTLTEASGSPVMADDKVLINCWYNLNDDTERPEIPDFDQMLLKYDSSKNGTISKQELPVDLMLLQRLEMKEIKNTSLTVREVFGGIDENLDKEIDKREWGLVIDFIKTFSKPSGLIAIKADSRGELSDSSVLWMITKNIAEVPSPIFYKNRAYMIKDGGFITCVDPEKGTVLYQTRIGNPGPYLASPVAANGLLYIFGYNGKLKILKAGDEFKVIGEHDFKSNIGATPAIIGNTIYIRTNHALIAYSETE
jgi:outer membrane protein assembly factor BamB